MNHEVHNLWDKACLPLTPLVDDVTLTRQNDVRIVRHPTSADRRARHGCASVVVRIRGRPADDRGQSRSLVSVAAVWLSRPVALVEKSCLPRAGTGRLRAACGRRLWANSLAKRVVRESVCGTDNDKTVYLEV